MCIEYTVETDGWKSVGTQPYSFGSFSHQGNLHQFMTVLPTFVRKEHIGD